MLPTLRVLVIDDSADDAELLIREVRRGYDVVSRRVDSPNEMRAALAQTWDAVLADYTMPSFSAFGALQLLQDVGIDIPFVIVSGTIDEDTAVEALQAGADDFVVKGRLARLLPAIARGIRQAEIRRQRNQVMEDLRQAVVARDEFLAIASHELRTPLTTLNLEIAAIIRRLKRESPSDIVQTLMSKAERASTQVDRLTVLISTLLDVNRIIQGRLTLAPLTCDLRAAVEQAIERKVVTAQSRARISVRAQRPVIGEWDRNALETIVINLLSNAIKFGDGKPIEIEIGLRDDLGCLVVIDHGIGIELQAQQRIFERFERAVPSTHYGGFGLGLWVTRKLVEAMGGSIEVSSVAGAGSTFTVMLPIRPPDSNHAYERTRG